MTNPVSKSFVVPEGFKKEEIVESQLYYEDLDEDDEIWLVRMSSDIELSDLDKKKICLSDSSSPVAIKSIKTEKGKILDSYCENCELPNVCVLLPKREDKKLCVVKKIIKGSILVSEGLSFDEEGVIKSEKEQEVEQEDNMESISNIKKRERKKKQNAHKLEDNSFDDEVINTRNLAIPVIQNDVEQEETNSGANSETRRKKNKKKKRSSHNFENADGYETELAENVVLPSKQKKHKKHKFEIPEIKSEPLSQDSDEFPHCVSQK